MSSSGKKERSNFGGFFGEYGTKSQSMVDKKLVVRKEKRESEEHDVSDDESMSDSQIRQNFDVEIEKLLNKQINLELQACYNYQSMVCHLCMKDYYKNKTGLMKRILSYTCIYI